MTVIGLILGAVGIGFFCWLMFTLAIYALPFFAGLTAGLAAFHGGAGVLGALAASPRSSLDKSPSPRRDRSSSASPSRCCSLYRQQSPAITRRSALPKSPCRRIAGASHSRLSARQSSAVWRGDG